MGFIMRILCCIIMLFVASEHSLARVDSTQQGRNDTDTTMKLPDDFVMVNGEMQLREFNLDTVLAQSRLDSTTCLGLRSAFKVDFLLETLHFDQRRKDEILRLLGPPNTSLPYRESAFSGLCRNPDDFEVIRYYYGSCYDGKVYTKGGCWLEIVVYKDSGKVKDAYWACD